jgi:hypothetical protein
MALRPFVFVAAISLAALAVGSNSDIAVISQYVISRKSWPAKVFRVERKECDCAYALYRIIYLPEDGKLPAANSKSFAVYYDEQRHRIVKETPFQ